MSRRLHTKRLVSAVLFSAPANMSTAKVDVWGGDGPNTRRSRNRSPGIPNQIRQREWKIDDDFTNKDDGFRNGESPSPIGFDIFVEFPDSPRRELPISPPPSDFPSTLTSRKSSSAPEFPATLCLPIVSVALKVMVDGSIAHTELTQTFHNPSDIEIPEARHTFPLYGGAVVTSFECIIGDERRLRGVVKPRKEARKVYEKAVKTNREAAALLEELTPEIFETSLGNIPPRTRVQIKLTYLQELKIVMMEEEKTEGLAVIIPTSIAPRYGDQPARRKPSPVLQINRLEIWVKVVDNGTINPEGCHVESGHDVEYEGTEPVEKAQAFSLADLGTGNESKTGASQTQCVWHYESRASVLKKDFILVIQMREGHHLLSRAVVSPANEKGHGAMMVTIRPNDLFGSAVRPQSFSGEILFLLDQSGSMGWTSEGSSRLKINTLRDAMSLVLSGLPDICVFNIISFGTATYGLWDRSRPYSVENIKEARTYASQVEANMGGTDLLRALKATVKRLTRARQSSQIIIITDGELELEPVVEFVWKTRQELQDKVRFFALGIGDNVSHRLIESIAELGGGYSDVIDVMKKPRWEDRLNRMVRSALQPDSWTFDISLGSNYEKRSLMAVQFGIEKLSDKSLVPYIQAPYPIPPLHPFSYKSIFILIDLRGGKLPSEVILTTTTPGTKSKSYYLSVETSNINNGAIHHLAAKASLLNLEEEVKKEVTESETACVNAESLGETYSITSKWTSFLAVAQNEPAEKQNREVNLYKTTLKDIDIDKLLRSLDVDDESEVESSAGSVEADRSINLRHANMFSLTGAKTAPPNEETPTDWGREVDVEGKSFSPGLHFEGSLPAYLPEAPIRHLMERSETSPCDATLTRSSRRQSQQHVSDSDDEGLCQIIVDSYYDALLHGIKSNVTSESSIAAERCCTTTKDSDSHWDVSETGSDHEAKFYKSIGDGPITWQDAVANQNIDGTFSLMGPVRLKLRRHFCSDTAKKLHEELQKFPNATELSDNMMDVLVDTMMIIQHFHTHMAPEEDSWGLIMDKAEYAVNTALRFSEEEEEKLIPMTHILRGSIVHKHFMTAMKRKGTDMAQRANGENPFKKVAKRCPVCEELFDVEHILQAQKRFLCTFEDSDPLTKHVWDDWDGFWEHQVKTGHMVCPEDNALLVAD
ncbi:uncharacterized protein BHQ10_009571 [Talaromyces amestolkiae]|uniref:VWFA domain-containing protein n=1 Tax=Talaromyces amestolkiae TaxID=1196081 RepID=A0A364LCQ9_TALAM|nr:uncharacterized protein BHQ10_009571 [Talaromyces amestolkiae]RAO73559.1 hypothetical protein BHQ10_009571 [Talaromyces amestolkiae]